MTAVLAALNSYLTAWALLQAVSEGHFQSFERRMAAPMSAVCSIADCHFKDWGDQIERRHFDGNFLEASSSVAIAVAA